MSRESLWIRRAKSQHASVVVSMWGKSFSVVICRVFKPLWPCVASEFHLCLYICISHPFSENAPCRSFTTFFLHYVYAPRERHAGTSTQFILTPRDLYARKSISWADDLALCMCMQQRRATWRSTKLSP
jgi:hypothetical protein